MTLVEIVARAIQRENRPKNDPLNEDQRDAADSESLSAYKALAIAALLSIRTPPPEVI